MELPAARAGEYLYHQVGMFVTIYFGVDRGGVVEWAWRGTLSTNRFNQLTGGE